MLKANIENNNSPYKRLILNNVCEKYFAGKKRE